MNSSVLNPGKRLLKKIIIAVARPLVNLYKTVAYLCTKNSGRKRILLYATYGACLVHVLDFTRTIHTLDARYFFYVSGPGQLAPEEKQMLDNRGIKVIRSRLMALCLYYDLIITGFSYPVKFRFKHTRLIYTNHGAHIIGVDNGDQTFTYKCVPECCPDMMLEANRYKADMIIKERPELSDIVKWVGWKFAETENGAVEHQKEIRDRLGYDQEDKIVFIVATWGPNNLFHTYGDAIFESIKGISDRYRVIVSAHYHEYYEPPTLYGVDFECKGKQVDELALYGCRIRRFDEDWIDYMAIADVVFTDYSTLSEEAVAMGKKVIFSNYPDSVVWKYSICRRARKYMPVVEDIGRLSEYIEQAISMELPPEIIEMKKETYISREEYDEKAVALTKELLYKRK